MNPVAEAANVRTVLRDDGGDASPVVFLDFDHTLFASNSTEEFIAACRPSAVVAVIDVLVRRCVPWRLAPLAHPYRLRDWVCVCLIVLLMPWNIWLWNRRAPSIFQQRASADVAGRLRQIAGERVILSFGMRFVIRALLRGSEYESCPLVATRVLSAPGHFGLGKLDLALATRGADATRGSTFLTDSEDDRDLLDHCANGMLLEPQGELFRARERLYLPMRYTATVKYGSTFTFDQLLFVDAAIYALSVAQGGFDLLRLALVAPLLALSFMTVYELGYFENDMEAAGREAKPALGSLVPRFRDYPIRWNAWIWGIATGTLAVWLAGLLGLREGNDFLSGAAAWTAVLIISRAVFRIYNGLSPAVRLYFYPALQVVKYGAPLVLWPATMLGALLVVVQIGVMWSNYTTYRLGGDNVKLPKDYIRFVLVLMGMIVLAMPAVWAAGADSIDPSMLVVPAAALLWMIARVARRPVGKALVARLRKAIR